MDFFRIEKKCLRVLSKEEETKLLFESCEHLKPIIIAALNTGMRKEEILSLTWDNVDFENNCITVEHTKNKEYRIIPMNEFLADVLKRIPRTSKYVFCKEDGERFQNVRTSFNKAVKRADIEFCRFHDLRHTFASRLVMAGVDIITVKELLGHKSIEMTMRYSHPTPEHKRLAVEKLPTGWTPGHI